MMLEETVPRYKFVYKVEIPKWEAAGWKLDNEDLHSPHEVVVMLWLDPETIPVIPKE